MKLNENQTDWFFLVPVFLLLVLGLLTLYSASDSDSGILVRQFVYVFIGVLVFVFASFFPLRILEEIIPFIYLLSLILLVLTIFLGGGPAGRWLQIGFINIQPSEFAKFCVIILAARWLPALKNESLVGGVSLFLVAVGILVLLTLLQPDLGTAVSMAFLVFGMIYWSGFGFAWVFFFLSPLLAAISSIKFFTWIIFTSVLSFILFISKAKQRRWVFFLVMTSVIAAATPSAWGLLRPYQQARLTTFLNPEDDPFGAGWNVIQSKVAVGSGGFAGQGYGQGSQNELAFLPARHTDFIFSVFAEEWGFLGSVFLLLLYLMIIWRLLIGASHAMNPFNSILSAGTAFFIMIHVLVNIGMTLGMMPVTGLPLPLVTYGGSHLITEMLLLGLSFNVIKNWRSY